MTASIVSFSEEILYFIANYLVSTEDQDQDQLVFRFSYDWRNFMNASKEYFGEWKKRSQLIVLNNFYAQRFRTSVEFRARIVQMIRSPLDQPELNFRSSRDWISDEREHFDMGLLGGIKKISAFDYHITNFPFIVVLFSCKRTEYSY
jgi:hypothetical protein